MSEKENIIVDRTIQFSLKFITYCEKLEEERKFVVSRQLLKSGSRIGANVHEAQNAESRADFIHKIKLSLKECEETLYWLTFCPYATTYPNTEPLMEDAVNIKRCFPKSYTLQGNSYGEMRNLHIYRSSHHHIKYN